MSKKNKYIIFCSGLLLSLAMFSGCLKQKLDQNWAGPYRDAVWPAIKFVSQFPSPVQGGEGDMVTFKIAGLDSLINIWSTDPSLITFQFNGVNAVIDTIRVADSIIRAIVPPNASSGSATLKIRNNTYFGPVFRVIGSLSIDSTFNRTGDLDEFGNVVLGGTSGAIRELRFTNVNNRQSLFLLGAFSQWNDSSSVDAPGGDRNYLSNIIEINPVNGALRNDFVKLGGPNGFLNGMLSLTAFPGYLIYGSFSRYNWNGSWDGPNNMTRIYRDGSLDYLVKEVYNPDPNSIRNIDTIPVFRGGTNAAPVKVFIDDRGRLISVGNFTSHHFNLIDDATFSNIPYRATYVPQVMAQDQLGNIDSSYGYIGITPGQRPFQGNINDAIQILGQGSPYGKIIIAGTFPDGLIMLDRDGKPDPSFQGKTNGRVTKITYNATTRKILIAGAFTQVNGMPAPAGLAMLNEDGSLTSTFNLGAITAATDIRGQVVTYAGQLSNGNIIVSGNFASYTQPDGSAPITRRGFMILNSSGYLAPLLNTTGLFRGQINDIFEYQMGTAQPKLVIAGAISVFDNVEVKNIVRLNMYR